MSKKKGLGKDINASIDTMDALLDCLKKFHGIPLKRGLKVNSAYDDDMAKDVNSVMTKAFDLNILVEDLRNRIAGVKPKANARFASQRVIDKFLSL